MPGWRVDQHSSKPRSAKGKERAMRALVAGTAMSDLEMFGNPIEQMMTEAKDIVARFQQNNGVYPSLKLSCRQDPSRAQEYADAKKLHEWKCNAHETQAAAVLEYLNQHMPNWRHSHVTTSANKRKNTPISKAREIFRRCEMRDGALPRLISHEEQSTPELILEYRDALKLQEWKESFTMNPETFCPKLQAYIQSKLPNWLDFDTLAMVSEGKATTGVSKEETVTKRKRDQAGSDNSTDDEEVSTDSGKSSSPSNPSKSSESVSDTLSIESDENAGAAALLQLGALSYPLKKLDNRAIMENFPQKLDNCAIMENFPQKRQKVDIGGNMGNVFENRQTLEIGANGMNEQGPSPCLAAVSPLVNFQGRSTYGNGNARQRSSYGQHRFTRF